MQNQIFRAKSLERLSTPEQLDDYIRVSSPTMWLLLIAIIVLLAGVCVWGIFGHLETTVDTAAQAREDGSLPQGIYEAKIVTEQVSPMSFVFN